MVSWGWIVMALGAGVIVGFFLMAFLQVAREEEEKKRSDGQCRHTTR